MLTQPAELLRCLVPYNIAHIVLWPQKKNGQEIPGIKCIFTADLCNGQILNSKCFGEQSKVQGEKNIFFFKWQVCLHLIFSLTLPHHMCNYNTGTRGPKPVWQLLYSQNWLTQIPWCATKSSLSTGSMWHSRSCVKDFLILTYTSWGIQLHIHSYTYLTTMLNPQHDYECLLLRNKYKSNCSLNTCMWSSITLYKYINNVNVAKDKKCNTLHCLH